MTASSDDMNQAVCLARGKRPKHRGRGGLEAGLYLLTGSLSGYEDIMGTFVRSKVGLVAGKAQAQARLATASWDGSEKNAPEPSSHKRAAHHGGVDNHNLTRWAWAWAWDGERRAWTWVSMVGQRQVGKRSITLDGRAREGPRPVLEGPFLVQGP